MSSNLKQDLNLNSKFFYLEKCTQMKYSILETRTTKLKVSKLGFGCSHLSKGVIFDRNTNLPTKGHEQRINLIFTALEQGVNLIDVAPLYGAGKCEIILGMALKNVSRSNYILSCKVGRTHDCDFDYSFNGVLKTFFESKKRLDVDQIDILNVHDVEFANIQEILIETLPALRHLQEKNLINFIGLTGYNLKIIREIIEKSQIKIDFVLSYSRFTLFDNELADYFHFFKKHKIEVLNAAPLGMGLLTDSNLPKWHPADDNLKIKCLKADNFCKMNNTELSKLALDHCFNSELIKTTLVGLNDEKLLDKNFKVLLNGLDSNEIKLKKEIQQKYFQNSVSKNWENIEVKNYQKNPKLFCENLKKELMK